MTDVDRTVPVPAAGIPTETGGRTGLEGWRFTELVDVPRLQLLLDSLYEATGIPTAVLDPEASVLTASGWQDVCVQFHRKNAGTAERCRESDLYLEREAGEKRTATYKCRNGLVDCACPILVDGCQIGTLFTGQFFLSPPDEGGFRRQAAQFGIDEEPYLEALRRVPVIEESRLPAILGFLSRLADTLADEGVRRLREAQRQQRILAELERGHETLVSNLPGIAYRCRNELTWPMEVIRGDAAGLTGFTSRELEEGGGVSWGEQIHPDDRNAVWAEVQAALRERRPFELTYRFRHQAGSYRWFWERGRGVFDESGALRALEGFVTDVTERHLAEEASRLGQERLALGLESARMGAWELDLVDGTAWRNPRHDQIFGYETLQPDWTFPRFLGHVVDADRTAVERSFSEAEATGHLHVECRIVRVDGAERSIEIQGKVVRDGAGRPALMLGTVLDITERKRSEQELRETRDFLENLIGHANAPIVVWDPELRITRFNHAFARLTGIPEEEALGSGLEVLFPEGHRAEAMERLRKASAGDRMETVEIPVRGAEGGVRTVLWNSATIFEEGGSVPRATIAQGQDVTERVAARRDLSVRAAELARSNAELEQFAYVASHDLQEPLRTVASYVQLLARRYRDRLDPDANDFIDFATEGVERMQRLIEDLLTYSRVGTRGRAFSAVEAGEALRSALRSLGEAVRESCAVVTHDPLPRVVADGGQLVQLLQNLLGNALKFRGSDPPRVHVSARREGEEWVFSVRDQGIGIAPEHFERIFRVFQRLHGREKYEGTGIGLAICKKIVERHGGRMGVDSEPGRGATFWFTLPAREEEP